MIAQRLWILAGVFVLLAAVFVARLVQLQLLHGDDYDADVQAARRIVDLLPAPRGRILDRSGLPLVDNRPSYHVAVVLRELELPRIRQRRVPFLVLDRRALELLAADLAGTLDRGTGELRALLEEEFLRSPGVGLRRGEELPAVDLGLLALERALLVAAEGAEDGPDPAWSALAESGLLRDDPREALEREFALRREQTAHLLDSEEFAALSRELGDPERIDIPGDEVARMLTPFAPQVALRIPGIAGEPEATATWRVFEDERLGRAASVLGRYAGRSSRAVEEHLVELLERERTPADPDAWFFVPASRTPELAARLPAGVSPRELALEGTPPGRERLLVIQGRDREVDAPRDCFLGLVDRLAVQLAIPDRAAWLAALIEHHARVENTATLERHHRRHLVAFDGVKLADFAAGLARRLAAGGETADPLDVRRALTLARRTAEREWRGSTRHDPIPVFEDISHELALSLGGLAAAPPRAQARAYQVTDPDLPGLRVLRETGRRYRFPGSASHLIGYLGGITSVYDPDTALAMGLDPAGWIGRSGLEAEYDEILQGVVGRRVRRRVAEGWEVVEHLPPAAGHDLVLELDSDLQRSAEDALGRWLELADELGLATDKMRAARERANHGRAGMVLMDVDSGAILALASRPGFDLRAVRRDYEELADPELHPGAPLHDHASEAAQPCGSSMKVLTALIGLKEGAIEPHTEIFSKGHMHVTPGGTRVLREHSPFSPRSYDVVQALQKSSNVFFATVGERVGKAQLCAYQRAFGFGRRHALDVGWQRPGILPSPDNIARIAPHEPYWTPYRTWSQAIGQGLSASPLQLVVVAAAPANGGRIVTPYLWRDARVPAPRDFGLPDGDLAAVRRGMEAVCEPGGTASSLRLDVDGRDVAVAAKTGTSEWGSSETRAEGLTPDHAWLIGYAPVERPLVAFAIYVHAGTSGGRAGTGIAKQVLEDYFAKYPGPDGHRGRVVPSQRE